MLAKSKEIRPELKFSDHGGGDVRSGSAPQKMPMPPRVQDDEARPRVGGSPLACGGEVRRGAGGGVEISH